MIGKKNYGEIGRKLFRQGYNCAQSVFCAFSEDLGIDFETALKLSSSFGGGMGRLREVCGAVSAMFMIAGIKYGYTSPDDDNVKEEHYTRIQKLAQSFKNKHETIICRNLLGLTCETDTPKPSKRTEKYYETRPCEQFVYDACEIIADYLNNNSTINHN